MVANGNRAACYVYNILLVRPMSRSLFATQHGRPVRYISPQNWIATITVLHSAVEAAEVLFTTGKVPERRNRNVMLGAKKEPRQAV